MHIATTPKDCPEWNRLFAEDQESARFYSLVVNALSEAKRRATREDYVRVQQTGELARKRTEQARSALEKHSVQHGC